MALTQNKRRPIIIGPDTPLDPKETDVWFDTSTSIIKRYNGSVWLPVVESSVESIAQAAASSASAYALSLATASISNLIDGAPGLLDTLNELAAALGDDANFATTVFGLIDSASVNNQWYTDYRVESASGSLVGYTNSQITNLETITNTNIDLTEASLIATINNASVANVNYTDSEIINLDLTQKLISASAAAVSYADSLTTSDVSEGTGLYFTNQRAIDAGSATYLTQVDAALNYLSLTNGGNVTGPVDFESQVTFSGSVTYVNTENLLIDDPLIYLAQNNITTDTLDSGFVTAYGEGANTGENHLHRGLIYDNSDNIWKLSSNFLHPIDNVVDFSGSNADSILLGSASVVGSVTASAFIGDGSQLTGINLATKKDKLNTFDQETANYILILSNADQIVEMNVSTANTLTVPPDASVNFPVGTEITVLQTGTGQTTLTPGAGVTINGTPGLKLRAQWASAMLIKRAANTWVAIGDLSA